MVKSEIKKLTIINKIGEKIDEYQTRTGATKTWLAEKMGISKQRLHLIAKSDNLTIETLIRIAWVLDCRVSELYDYEVEFEDNQ